MAAREQDNLRRGRYDGEVVEDTVNSSEDFPIPSRQLSQSARDKPIYVVTRIALQNALESYNNV